jgi:hypothetical protein
MERIVDVAKTGRMDTHGCPVSAAETERVEALSCLVLCRIDGEGGDTWFPQSEKEPLWTSEEEPLEQDGGRRKRSIVLLQKLGGRGVEGYKNETETKNVEREKKWKENQFR